MWQNFTERVKRVFQTAQKEALRLGHEVIGTEHILLGLLKEDDDYIKKILFACNIQPKTLIDEVEKFAGVGTPRTDIIDLPMSPRAKSIMDLSMREAHRVGANYIGTEHLLIAILAEGDGLAARLLASHGVTIEECRTISADIRHKTDNRQNISEAKDERIFRVGIPLGRHSTTKGSIVEQLAIDLSKMAEDGELDPVIGRTKETQRLVQILSRRRKNNPVLIGEAGVGKTAVVEGLAQRIASGNIPEILREKRVMQLNVANLVAGTKYRGEFEERMHRLIKEIRESKNYIVFIDEIHTIVGAGGADSAVDAANVLKPSLSRGEFQVIGATTIAEYRKHIEKDAALERRFQPIIVDEPDIDETIEILKGLREKYEEHHHVKITDDALEAATKLSKRFITDRFLPDKAIDVIDEASARARINIFDLPEEFKAIELTIASIRGEKESAAAAQEFEKAANLRDEEHKIREQYEEMLREWSIERNSLLPEINSKEIAALISENTGIPVSQITATESQRLLNMEEELHKKIVGQDEAVKAICTAVRRARSGMKDPRRPVGSFLFLGPTGVGKTELARTVAEFLFGNDDAVIRFDMSEYMERHEVAKLIGAPPGYVGFEDGGKLTEAIRRKPYSVVLFDEIEKAHTDVFNLLLQVLEDGVLTDGHGHKSSFRDSVIIMTSNVGINNSIYAKSLGFGINSEENQNENTRMKDVIQSAVKKTFRPEFLNRIDEMIVFSMLGKNELLKIVDIMLKGVSERAKENGITLKIDNAAKNYLLEKGYDPKFGARPLRRAIQKYIEDEIAARIIDGRLSGGNLISITANGENLDFFSAK